MGDKPTAPATLTAPRENRLKIAQIENNPNLTARILSALKTGSVKAFEQFLSHPAASFVIGALEDWQKNKGT